MGLGIGFPALVEQYDVTHGLLGSLFVDPNQARMCCKFPGQVRALALLHRRGKPRAMISVQMPTICLTIEWAVQLLVCSSYFP